MPLSIRAVARSLGRMRARRRSGKGRGEGTRKAKTVDDRLTLMEHLIELRHRLVVSAVAITIGSVVMFAAYNSVLRFFTSSYRDVTNDPNKKLIITDPLEGFATRLRVAGYGGLMLALPVVLYQLWRFVTPALNKKEKRYAVPFVVSSVILFFFGGVVAMLTLPQALRFLVGVSGPEIETFFTPSKYLRLVTLMILGFGIAFELPILLVFLQLARVLSSRQLLSWWRPAIVVIVVLAAVITPSQDPISLAAMAVPMVFFYFASVLIGRLAKR